MLIAARQRGFNLVEAAVTVSVLGVLLATGLPGMTDWIRATHVRGLTETTQTGLQKARSEAMKRNKVVTFWMVTPTSTTLPDDTCALSTGSAAWVVSLDDPSSHCSVSPSPTVTPRIVEIYGPGKAADGITVTAVDKDGNAASSVSFNGFGQRVGGGMAKIDLVHAASTDVRPLRIEISTSGGIRMCDPRATAADANDARACQMP
ncbi:GspH/FimT family pseudopilin [Ramlibacter sp. AN1133]|uniref:GspH/FimT family pseudopilin n=1 Tax=Ramlibacter sp. AN1133 TaxID=3133429 RepID=UPI0030C44BCC